MAFGYVQLDRLTFVYDSAREPLLENVSLQLGVGWTGVVGPNGAGKTTLLRIIAGEYSPTSGHVSRPGDAVYCPQRTDSPPDGLGELLADFEGEAGALKGRLGIGDDWLSRWSTLSHGERKRAQIGVALWRRPDVLLIDEPTNHIDREARALLAGALKSFRGTGLLVSHDRELLDSLCAQCLFIEAPNVVAWAGGYTKASAAAAAERERLRLERERARDELKRLQREAAIRGRESAAEHKKRSKSGLAPKDHDARARINLARLTDSKAGQAQRQLDGRLEQAESRLASNFVAREHHASMRLAGQRSGRNELFRIMESDVSLGGGRSLSLPDLAMAPQDRIALVGPNGGGKSTLIRHIMGQIPLPSDRIVYLPQEIGRDESQHIVRQVRQLTNEKLGALMGIVGALGSRPDRLIQTHEPSPGEIRKLLLALGMSRSPELIVMDEPTNHLDLPSIECMERALADCPSALLLVSHDERFLGELTHRRWQIAAESADRMRLSIIEAQQR